jgi:hypothetical protein
LLYSPQGKLQFSGGITESRGHVGDNAGRAAVLAALTTDAPPEQTNAFVFGCALTGNTPPPGLLDAWRHALQALRARWYGGAAA